MSSLLENLSNLRRRIRLQLLVVDLVQESILFQPRLRASRSHGGSYGIEEVAEIIQFFSLGSLSSCFEVSTRICLLESRAPIRHP
jgi:hypothetical protein